MTQNNEVYFHIKATRHKEMVVNTVFFGGDLEIQCPQCGIWNMIRFHPNGKVEHDRSVDPPAETVEDELLAHAENA